MERGGGTVGEGDKAKGGETGSNGCKMGAGGTERRLRRGGWEARWREPASEGAEDKDGLGSQQEGGGGQAPGSGSPGPLPLLPLWAPSPGRGVGASAEPMSPDSGSAEGWGEEATETEKRWRPRERGIGTQRAGDGDLERAEEGLGPGKGSRQTEERPRFGGLILTWGRACRPQPLPQPLKFPNDCNLSLGRGRSGPPRGDSGGRLSALSAPRRLQAGSQTTLLSCAWAAGLSPRPRPRPC